MLKFRFKIKVQYVTSDITPIVQAHIPNCNVENTAKYSLAKISSCMDKESNNNNSNNNNNKFINVSIVLVFTSKKLIGDTYLKTI